MRPDVAVIWGMWNLSWTVAGKSSASWGQSGILSSRRVARFTHASRRLLDQHGTDSGWTRVSAPAAGSRWPGTQI